MGEGVWDFAQRLNRLALSIIRDEGEHAAMFFLLMPDGEVLPKLFAHADAPVGEQRTRELGDAAASSGAQALAFVSEASGGTPENEAHDVLFVAAIDRTGETAVLETPLSRREDGTVEPGESRVWDSDYDVNVFDGVRAAWGLARRRDLGFGVSAEMPDDWDVRKADKIIELLPPSENAAAHISVFRRRPQAVEAGEARAMVERLPAWCNASERVGPSERPEGSDRVATGSCVDAGLRFDVAVRVGPGSALVFSFNDDGSEDELLEAARSIFESIVVAQPAK